MTGTVPHAAVQHCPVQLPGLNDFTYVPGPVRTQFGTLIRIPSLRFARTLRHRSGPGGYNDHSQYIVYVQEVRERLLTRLDTFSILYIQPCAERVRGSLDHVRRAQY